MKKMMLLASIVALTAMMLAAAPAFAQDTPGNACEHEGQGVPPFCRDEDEDFVFVNDDDDDNDNDNDRDVFRNLDFGNVDVSPTIDISQETEQDCDSGEVSQPVNVTGDGDNSIQTVGLQPTAVTGCAQNATGVLQAAPIVAGLGGDTIFNTDDNGDNDGRFIRCDRDGDGNDDGDDCDDFDNDRVFCDRDGDGNDDGDDDCFVFVNDDNGDNGDNGDRFRNIGNDELNITGPDFGDVDVDSNSSIDASPSQVINGGGTIDQDATAISTQVFPKWWWM